jgi:peptide/nickel transport system substrate-binding protein
VGTPYIFLYALHDALIKPLPSKALTPYLAESWTEIDDGLSVAFKLRQGSKFHNGDPLTAADVKFSFARYKEASAKLCRVTGTAAQGTAARGRVDSTLKRKEVIARRSRHSSQSKLGAADGCGRNVDA